MFVRDAEFKHTGIMHQPETTKHRTGAEVSWITTTVDPFRHNRPKTLQFRAQLFDDGHWRVHIRPDNLPSVDFTGVGDTNDLLEEFVEFNRKFLAFWATPTADRVEPWEEIR